MRYSEIKIKSRNQVVNRLADDARHQMTIGQKILHVRRFICILFGKEINQFRIRL